MTKDEFNKLVSNGEARLQKSAVAEKKLQTMNGNDQHGKHNRIRDVGKRVTKKSK